MQNTWQTDRDLDITHKYTCTLRGDKTFQLCQLKHLKTDEYISTAQYISSVTGQTIINLSK